jgi:Tfp pilus assembly protein PilF
VSLLIKALEQAAKDRDSAKAAGAAAPASVEPTLEPPPPPRAKSTLDAGAREAAAANEPPAFARGTPSLDPAAPPSPRAASPAAPAPAARSVEPAAPPQRSAPAPASRGGLAERAAAPRRPAPAPRPAAPARPAAATGASAVAAAPGRGREITPSLEAIDAQEQRARAATVMQASSGVGEMAGNAFAYLRSNPVAAVGALALLCGVGYGVYVYLQISNPSLFIRQAAKHPETPPASAQAPTTPAPVPPTSTAPVAAAPAAAPSPDAGSVAGMATPFGAPGAATAAAPAGTTGAVSTASVINAPRASEAPARIEPRSERIAEPNRERGSIAASAAAPAAEPAPRTPTAPRASASAASVPSQDAERIAIKPATVQPRINPALAEGYSALQAGSLDAAKKAYSRALDNEPRNVDAMLGLAYIAAEENRTDDAVRFYTRILEVNPRNAQAQAAMIGLVGRADPIASETRLKQLLARDPSAFLHFVLGNLYADQGLWSQAQQSYFQAHHLEPGNPDYAYNLAIGLDHLGQSKLALNFYRLADQLASASGRANFSVAHARERIGALSSRLD